MEVVEGTAGAWRDPMGQRRRFSNPGANAYLGPAFNACAGSPDSSLLRYTRPSSDLAPCKPGSPIHQLLHLRSPAGPKTVNVKLQEDVLVMDGVLVTQAEQIRRGRGRVSDEFGVPLMVSSSGSNNTLYKGMMRRQWEESAGRSSVSNALVNNSPRSAESGVYDWKSLPLGSSTPTARKQAVGRHGAAREQTRASEIDTSAEARHINSVLYGPSSRRRLPVFVQICPQ